jgi:hypothetical protein
MRHLGMTSRLATQDARAHILVKGDDGDRHQQLIGGAS